MSKVTKAFRRMSEMYRQFAGDGFDYSESALLSQFEHESYGAPKPDDGISTVMGGADSTPNGYTRGKAMMGVWLESVLDDLASCELPLAMLWSHYPDWFLRKVLPKHYVDCWDRVSAMALGDVRLLVSGRARRLAGLPRTYTPCGATQ